MTHFTKSVAGFAVAIGAVTMVIAIMLLVAGGKVLPGPEARPVPARTNFIPSSS